VVFLAGLGSFMFYDYFVLHKKLLKRVEKEKFSNSAGMENKQLRSGIVEKLHNLNLPPMISFPKSHIEQVSLWVVIIIFLFTGFLSGILGIGGGFIILPTLVYLIGLPTVLAVGTSLITVLATSAFGCFTYAIDGRVEVTAAIIMLIGASIGAQIGATAVKYIKGYGIRLLFAIMISLTSFSVITEQYYKMTLKPFFQTSSGIILLGTAIAMSIIIIGKLLIEWNKEKRTILKPTK
jgi:uncharacterized membrane protein YfcA